MSFAPLLQAAQILGPALVTQGLEKINPKFKNFFSKAASYGYTADQSIDYLRKKFANPNQQAYQNQLQSRVAGGMARPDEQASMADIHQRELPGNVLQKLGAFGGAGLTSRGQEQQQPAQQQEAQPEAKEQQTENIIAKYSPELHDFISKHLQSGRSHEEAGALARSQKQFSLIIKKIEKDAKKRWSEVLREVYQGQAQQPAQGQPGQGERQPNEKMNRLSQLLQTYNQVRGR